MVTKTSNLVKSMKQQNMKVTPIGTEIILPNLSGLKGNQDAKNVLGEYVPYTGATSNVNLGSKNLTTTGIINTDSVDIGKASTSALSTIQSSGFPVVTYQRNVTIDGYYGTCRFLAKDSADMTDAFGLNVLLAIQDDTSGLQNIAAFGAMRDGADNNGKLVFSTYKGGGVTTWMTLDSTGALTIGTPTGAALHTFQSTSFPVVTFKRLVSSTDGYNGVARFLDYTSGDMVDGHGPNFLFAIEDATSGVQNIAAIGAKRSGADNSGQLVFNTYSAGSLGTWLTIDKDGSITTTTDNQKLKFGTGSDASILYDGTNLCINTKDVGTGTIKINGTAAVADGTYNTGQGPLGGMGTITTKAGIITAITQAT